MVTDFVDSETVRPKPVGGKAKRPRRFHSRTSRSLGGGLHLAAPEKEGRLSTEGLGERWRKGRWDPQNASRPRPGGQAAPRLWDRLKGRAAGLGDARHTYGGAPC